MGTDQEWEKWGASDPYFGVVTNEAFRLETLDDAGRTEFFKTGADHIKAVLSRCKHVFGGDLNFTSALDFGCGVGRVTLPLASQCKHVVGVDISQSMLDEAARNAADAGLRNVEFRLSDDTLSRVTERFDFVHTHIVLQHIPIDRGTQIFAELVDRVAPGGVAAIQLTYANTSPQNALGKRARQFIRSGKSLLPGNSDPVMQMYHYNLNDVFFVLQSRNIRQVTVDFTDHGGELGVDLLFRTPA